MAKVSALSAVVYWRPFIPWMGRFDEGAGSWRNFLAIFHKFLGSPSVRVAVKDCQSASRWSLRASLTSSHSWLAKRLSRGSSVLRALFRARFLARMRFLIAVGNVGPWGRWAGVREQDETAFCISEEKVSISELMSSTERRGGTEDSVRVWGKKDQLIFWRICTGM